MLKNIILGIAIILILSPIALASWESLPSGTDQNLPGIFFYSQNLGWAVGGNGIGILGAHPTILKSTDGGDLWVSQSLPVGIDSTIVLSDVCFATSTHGWAVGSNGIILRTVDGSTWTQLNTPGANYYAVECLDENTAIMVGNPGLRGTTYYGNILKTVNGVNFTSKYGDGRAVLYDTFFSSDTVGWAVGEDATGDLVLKTEDGGERWTRQATGISIGPNSIHCIDSTCWLAGFQSQIHKLSGIWNTYDSGWSVGKHIYFINATTGFMGGQNILLESDDGGMSWGSSSTDISNSLGLLPVSFMRGITCNRNVCWIAGDGGRILRWGIPRFEILISPPNITRMAPNQSEPVDQPRGINCTARMHDCEIGWNPVWEYNASGCTINYVCVQDTLQNYSLDFTNPQLMAFLAQAPGLGNDERINIQLSMEMGEQQTFSVVLHDRKVKKIGTQSFDDYTLQIKFHETTLREILTAQRPADTALQALRSGQIVVHGGSMGMKIKVGFLRLALRLGFFS